MSQRKSAAQVEDGLNAASVMEYLAAVPDPRMDRTRLHSLKDILVLSLCAIICGADGFVAIEEFGILKEAWLKTFGSLARWVGRLCRVTATGTASPFPVDRPRTA